jgi:choline/glycine/proline betaine transport protein
MPKRELLAAALILSFVAITLASPETANAAFVGVKDQIVLHFDAFFTTAASAALLLVVALALVPRFNVRLGGPQDRPEFTRLSWFSMLLSAGLASGILYWATAEPLTHFQSSPHLARSGIEAGTAAAARNATALTIFHWGLHGWGFYALTGLSAAFFAYRQNRPLALSSTVFAPNQTGTARGLAIAIDLIGVLGTVFGLATSMGIAVGAMNAALGELLDLPMSATHQLWILALVTALGIGSVVLGLRRGIARLSQLNLLMSVALLLAMLLLGPTGFLLGFIATATTDYALGVLPMGFWTGSAADDVAWQGAWTVFYWGWWLAWAPSVGLFIARISRGRTLREFVTGVLLIPTAAVILWMAVFGGVALEGELSGAQSILPVVNDNYALATVATIRRMDVLALPLIVLVTVLLFSWLITSLDSVTLILCTALRSEKQNQSNPQKALWGSALGLVTAALIYAGGLDALQAAAIIAGLPIALVLLATAIVLVRALLQAAD